MSKCMSKILFPSTIHTYFRPVLCAQPAPSLSTDIHCVMLWVQTLPFSTFRSFIFETGSYHVALMGLELAGSTKLALKSKTLTCFCLLRAWMKGEPRRT